MGVYADRGARGATLSAVAEEAGVTHSAVLYHFDSADGLLREVLQERDRQMQHSLVHLLDGTPAEVLSRLPEIGRYNQERVELVRLYLTIYVESLSPESPGHEWYVRRSDEMRTHLAALLEEGRSSGDFRPDLDARLKAEEIVAFMEGAHLTFLLDPERTDLVAVFESYRDSLLASLRPPTDRSPS